MKLILFATRKMGYDGLVRFVEDGHIIQAVYTKDYEITESYGSDRFTQFCNAHQIPVFVTEDVHQPEHLEFIKHLSPDLGVSLYWRRLLREPLISIPRYGFINTHASKLPRYRGFAATSWAIVLGDKEVGITVHRINDGVADDGDIFAQEIMNLDPDMTIKDLFEQVNTKTVELNASVIIAMERGTLSPTPQPKEGIVHAYPRLPVDGKIDWHRPAAEIDRLIRATARPYPGAFTYIYEEDIYKRLFIWKAGEITQKDAWVGIPGHVIKNDPESGECWVLTGDGIMALKEVQIEGGQPFAPGTRWQSLQMRLGMIPEEAILDLQHRLLGKKD